MNEYEKQEDFIAIFIALYAVFFVLFIDGNLSNMSFRM